MRKITMSMMILSSSGFEHLLVIKLGVDAKRAVGVSLFREGQRAEGRCSTIRAQPPVADLWSVILVAKGARELDRHGVIERFSDT
jgi:hypothetical protein